MPTTKYSVTIDLERLVDLMAKGSEKLSSEFADGLRELRDRIDLSRLPGAVWLDEAGRVRRFRLAMPIPGDNVSVVSTTEFYDFGAPVSISAPPEAEIVPFADAMHAMQEFFATLLPDAPASNAA